MIKLHDLLEEYTTITEADDDNMLKIKTAITKLPIFQQQVFLVYTELGSYRKAAKQFNCSAPTIKKIINEIKCILFI